MNARLLIVAALLSAVAMGTIVVLSQAQIIFLPYFTPAKIEFQGLQNEYPVNGSMTYTVSLKGYGSNCIGFTAGALRKEGAVRKGEGRVAYCSKTDDCRQI